MREQVSTQQQSVRQRVNVCPSACVLPQSLLLSKVPLLCPLHQLGAFTFCSRICTVNEFALLTLDSNQEEECLFCFSSAMNGVLLLAVEQTLF